MTEQTCREQIVQAGKALVQRGLIARTWGNVSCRLDDATFAITPSGRSYETLLPEEVVICRTEDCSYAGDIKPSSEKKIHALLYRLYPEIHFVIHTHQIAASVLSVTRYKTIDSLLVPGNVIPIAAYGLPGTKKLCKGVENALPLCKGTPLNKGGAVILAHHGALCFGEDYETAFTAAETLEADCEAFMQNAYCRMTEDKSYNLDALCQYFLNTCTPIKNIRLGQPNMLRDSHRTDGGFVMDGSETVYSFNNKNLSPEVMLHSAIYQARDDVRFVSQDAFLPVYTLSLARQGIHPLLDDFAQIVGNGANSAQTDSPIEVVKALGKRASVLVPGYGAICCAASAPDLHAVKLVLEKNSLAEVGACVLGGGRRLGLADCLLMNFVYRKSYSKKATQ